MISLIFSIFIFPFKTVISVILYVIKFIVIILIGIVVGKTLIFEKFTKSKILKDKSKTSRRFKDEPAIRKSSRLQMFTNREKA